MDNVREKLVEMVRSAHKKCKAHKTCHECEVYGNGSDCVYMFIADHLIANGVTVQQWRPASEPPKEDCKPVLVYFEYFRYGDYNRLFRTIGLGYVLGGEWSRFINGESGWHKLKILAWMPLPQPPKGE